ncbi:MAG: hypothetical protein RLZZ501_1426 [Pseudomonadota bacterium]|jgi:hypothetical protein
MPPDCPTGECIATNLKADQAALRTKIEDMEADIRDVRADVRSLLDIAATGRGSLRALLLIGGALASVLSALAWLYGTFVAHR